MQEENKALRQASVHIQAKAEQEEEFISNTLLKKIQSLKKEKESLALNYEQEEECLTNDLSRKLNQLRQEKVQLEHTLEQEQECLVNKLMRKIEKLETETNSKQTTLDQLRREKVQLENTLEQEQEALVNRLWKRMDKLESEKRGLQVKLNQPISEPPSPRDIQITNGDTAANLANNIHQLRQECLKLRTCLAEEEQNHRQRMSEFEKEEKHIREENLRLQRKLQLEMERREALCRHLSESESSLEMEEERVVNEMMLSGGQGHPLSAVHRSRTLSSPVPAAYPGQPPAPSPSPTLSRPLSPGLNYGERRESGGPVPHAAQQADSFTPPAALAKFPTGLSASQTGFAPIGGAVARSLPPRPPQEDHRYGIPRPEKFAKPGTPLSVSTSPGPPATSQSISPSIGDALRQETLPPSPMDAESENA